MKVSPLIFCWTTCAALCILAVTAWVWSEVGAAAAWGLPISAVFSVLTATPLILSCQTGPRRPLLMVSAFVWGASVAFLGSIWSHEVAQMFLNDHAWAALAPRSRASLIDAATTALFQGLFLLWILRYRQMIFHGLSDGLLYGGLVGAGFSFFEGVMYFGLLAFRYTTDVSPLALGYDLGMSFVLRGLLVPYVHLISAAMIGLGVAYAGRNRSFLPKVGAVLLGLIASITTNGAWGWAAISGDSGLRYEIGAGVVVPLLFTVTLTTLQLRHRRA